MTHDSHDSGSARPTSNLRPVEDGRTGAEAEATASQQPGGSTAVRGEFARRKRRQFVLAVPFIGLIVLIAIKRGSVDKTLFGISPAIWAPVVLVLVLGALAFSFYNWRCPACGGYLGRTLNPRHCVSCGTTLRD